MKEPVMLRNKLMWVLAGVLCAFAGHAAEMNPEPSSPPKPNAHASRAGKEIAPIDRVVAVVNDDVITQHELDDRLAAISKQLQKQGTQLPPPDDFKKQVLERMIMDMLQLQFAKETGVHVDDVQLDRALERIAQENKFATLADFRAKLLQDGVDFSKFREEIRNEIIQSRLREREVDNKIIISDGEVDNYLAQQAKLQGHGIEYQLAHILILVPEQASAEQIEDKRQRAELAATRLAQGVDFAQVAAQYSDAGDAMQGGNLGVRSADRIPAMFLDVLQKMQPGEVSPIMRGPNGFHILKLIAKRNKDAPVVITQTHVRHILIKTSALVPEREAKARLMEIKQRVDAGVDFAEQARRYSDDGSAANGGDLGWVSPGDTVPEFEAAMNALKAGQVSDAVQTSFGWHLIQVLDRRNADVSVEQKRLQARKALGAIKSEDAFQDWLRQLRDRAYVEYHLDD